MCIIFENTEINATNCSRYLELFYWPILRFVLNDTMAIDAHVAKILVVHSRVLYIKSSSLIPLEEMVNTICPKLIQIIYILMNIHKHVARLVSRGGNFFLEAT